MDFRDYTITDIVSMHNTLDQLQRDLNRADKDTPAVTDYLTAQKNVLVHIIGERAIEEFSVHSLRFPSSSS